MPKAQLKRLAEPDVPKASKASEMGWKQLALKAEGDSKFREHLLSNPSPVLKRYKIAIPEGFNARVVLEKNAISCVLEPKAPKGTTELTEDDLKSVVGGGRKSSGGNASGMTFLVSTFKLVAVK